MDYSSLSAVGISGGAVSLAFVVWRFGSKIFKSTCIRGNDGNMHLDVALNLSAAATQAVLADPELHRDYNALLARLASAILVPPQVPVPSATPVVTVVSP